MECFPYARQYAYSFLPLHPPQSCETAVNNGITFPILQVMGAEVWLGEGVMTKLLQGPQGV